MSTTRRFSALLWVAILVPPATGILVVPAALQASSNSEASKRTDDIAACSRQYEAAIDAAELEEDRARERREAAVGDVIIYAVANNDVATLAATARITTATREIARAMRMREAALNVRAKGIALSRSDPDAFLAECERHA